MGRRKFRFSDMMPNSWFYKLRDMRRAGGHSSGAGGVVRQSSSYLGTKGSAQQAGTPRPMPLQMPNRASYYYASRDRVLQPPPAPSQTARSAAAEDQHQQLVPQTQSPAKSYRRRQRVEPARKAAPVEAEAPDTHHHRRRDTCIGRGGDVDAGKQLRKAAGKAPPSSKENIFPGKVIASETDIIFDLYADDVPERMLRPIVTKPAAKKKERHAAVASEQGGGKGNSGRRSSVSSSGCRLKTRANSPRLASPRCRARTRSSTTNLAEKTAPPLAESFAVVKASVDPRKDFRESMEEMIAVNGVRGAEDLEDLLAWYLALNAGEHHDLIVEVFEEIWASLNP